MTDLVLNDTDAAVVFRTDGSVQIIAPNMDDDAIVGESLMAACVAAALHKWPDLYEEARRRFLSAADEGRP